MPILMNDDLITQPQIDYIAAIAKRFSLPVRMMNDHAVTRFGKPVRELSKREASALLDEILTWQALPAEMARAKGQQDLPGFGGSA